MIRILQIIDHMGSGGIQAFIMNVYRNIDRNQIQFDFLLHHRYDHAYYKEVEQLGGHIYYVPPRSEGILKNRKALNNFFDSHPEYQIVHMHESSLSYITPLQVASEYGVRKRIIHSHNSNIAGNQLHRALHWWHKKSVHKVATHYLACGELAAKWMYGGSKVEDNAKVVYNGIDIKSYEFNTSMRKSVRDEFGIPDNAIVIGHVGRFDDVKNHHYLVDILAAMKEIHDKSYLMLIGNGPRFEGTKHYAKELNVENNVLFLGIRGDVSRLLQGVDVFVLPSFYEGFPVVAVEAQSAGLPVLMSDTISDEVIIKENVEQMSIQLPAEKWAKRIVELSSQRITDNDILYKNGFDVSSTVKFLSDLYLS